MLSVSQSWGRKELTGWVSANPRGESNYQASVNQSRKKNRVNIRLALSVPNTWHWETPADVYGPGWSLCTYTLWCSKQTCKWDMFLVPTNATRLRLTVHYWIFSLIIPPALNVDPLIQARKHWSNQSFNNDVNQRKITKSLDYWSSRRV